MSPSKAGLSCSLLTPTLTSQLLPLSLGLLTTGKPAALVPPPGGGGGVGGS
jgi:hypothetical protein